ncbi:uncharacterized protein CXorf66 homolog [Choloepus didactylus]|uniref:uncharacterized protein CXorf66 homolog n=1 Tax=Choloepus didactylus TaxID=27675 RepID=UPI00189D163D|nr:uncharacterized protein CXorf66 homolog [Choloepus didactylus]
MNLFIYVLFLSIWTNSCFNTNQGNVSSTTGNNPLQSLVARMDNFRRRLLVIIIGIMIVSFAFTCFCFLHYNCVSDDVPRGGGMTTNREIVANSSKLSLSATKTSSLCSPEKQSLLPSVDKLYGLPSPEKSSIPSSAEKLIRHSSTEKSSLPSSTEKMIRTPSPGKSSMPSSAEKLSRTPSPEKSSIPSSAEKLIRESSPEKPFLPSSAEKSIRQSSPEKGFKSSNLEKSARETNLKKPYKLASQVCSSYPDKPVRPSRSANPQYPARPAKSPHLHSPQNKKFPPKSSCPRKHAGMKIAENPSFSRELKSYFRFYHKRASMYKEYCNEVSDSDLMTYDSEDDSDGEVTIICNIRVTGLSACGIYTWSSTTSVQVFWSS